MHSKPLIIFFLLCCAFLWGEKGLSEEVEHQKMSTTPEGYAPVEIDPSRIQSYGVLTEEIKVQDLTKTIRTVGIVTADERRVATIQTKFNGWIEELYVNYTNQPVKKGDPLFTVYSPQLLSTEEEYLLALKSLDHPVQGQFSQEWNTSNRALLESVRRRLELWGISEDQIRKLEREKKPFRTLTYYSPIEGIVIEKNVFEGMNVEPGKVLFTITDLSHLWVLADIYEQDLAFVHMGQEAQVFIDAYPDKTFNGTITFINYVVDPSTRTTKIRIEIDNTNFLLKPAMYTKVLINDQIGQGLALPSDALIDTGKRKIVFVEQKPGYFLPREVQLGLKVDQYYQVLSGLSEGEKVVTSSQFLLDSESRLKAAGGGMEGMEMGQKKKP